MLRALLTGRSNVHLLHIRKTGGTALKNVLTQHGVTERFAIHTHPHRYRLMDVPRGHHVMFVVRDPVKRFVSGFQSRLRMGAPANYIPWSPDEERAFSYFPDPESLALALAPEHPLHSQAVQAMSAITHVGPFYADWLGSLDLLRKRERDIVYIGHTEALDDEFEALATFLGLPVGASLPQEPKLANRSEASGGQTTPLGADAANLVRSWYAPDYPLLDFCEEWRARQGSSIVKELF